MPYKDPALRAECWSRSQRERYAARRRAGVCLSCRARAKPGRVYCEVHLLIASNRKKRERLLRLDLGLCIVTGCPEKHLPERTRCARHDAYYRGYYKRGKANGNLTRPPVDPAGGEAGPDRRAQPHEPPGPGHVRPGRT